MCSPKEDTTDGVQNEFDMLTLSNGRGSGKFSAARGYDECEPVARARL